TTQAAAAGAYPAIVTKAGALSNRNFAIYILAPSQLDAELSANGTAITLFGPAVNDGQWHYAALTADSTMGLARLYLDGALNQEAGFSGTVDAPAVGVSVGQWSGGGGAFGGLVDEVRIS